MYSTSSLEEGEVNTPSGKRKLGRRKSDPPEYKNSKQSSKSGSMKSGNSGDLIPTLTRRDKTTGLCLSHVYVHMCMCVLFLIMYKRGGSISMSCTYLVASW